jgi:hypothetical protein
VEHDPKRLRGLQVDDHLNFVGSSTAGRLASRPSGFSDIRRALGDGNQVRTIICQKACPVKYRPPLKPAKSHASSECAAIVSCTAMTGIRSLASVRNV